MADPAVSDILVNRHDQIYVERLVAGTDARGLHR
jgi:Flp pilus assembly CpaF family ATPase